MSRTHRRIEGVAAVPTRPGLPPGALLRLVLLACIWGASFLLIKIALEGLSPTQVVLGRLVAGAVVLLGVAVVRRQPLPREPRLLAHLALLAMVGNILPFFLFAWAEQRVASGLAGVLNGTTPLFTLAFAVGFLPSERLSLQRAAGFLIGFAGVVLVVGPWDGGGATGSFSGQLACLGAAAAYGVGFVYARRFVSHRGHRPLELACAQLTIAAVALIAAAPFVAASTATLTPSVLGSVVVLGGAGTGYAYLLYYRLIAEAGATTASMVTYLIPIVAVALGIVVLAEPITWNVFAGTAVVIAGVALAEGRLGRRRGATGRPPTAAGRS